MLVVEPVLALRFVFGCFLQMKFHSVQITDNVEPLPPLTERETYLLVIRNRALKVVDEKLWSERCDTWLHRCSIRGCQYPGRRRWCAIAITRITLEDCRF